MGALPRHRRHLKGGVPRVAEKTPFFNWAHFRGGLGHIAWIVAFLGSFALCFFLSFAFIRGILHGPDSAWSFLWDTNGKMGVGEFAWTMLLSSVGAIVITVYVQKLLVKSGVLSQKQVEETWKE